MTIKSDDGSTYIELDVENIYETGLAVRLSNGYKEEWFPKEVLEDWPSKGEEGTAIVLESWAKKKGFI